MKHSASALSYTESCYSKGPHGNSQTNQPIAKLWGNLHNVKAVLLRITPTHITEHREVELLPT